MQNGQTPRDQEFLDACKLTREKNGQLRANHPSMRASISGSSFRTIAVPKTETYNAETDFLIPRQELSEPRLKMS